MLFPPTEREAVLAEVRAAITDHLAGMCRATREACECCNGGMGDHEYKDSHGEGCHGCPVDRGRDVLAVLDRLARK